MKKLNRGYVIPSSAFVASRKIINGYDFVAKKPEIGDLIYGEVVRIGQHNSLENCEGRIHNIYQGTKAVFTFGNRYAPDYYEGLIPEDMGEVDLLARSGMVGKVISKSSKIIDPTVIKPLGYVLNKNGEVINTVKIPIIQPKSIEKKLPRAKLILVVGTAMNSGKSAAAVACCRSIANSGRNVRAAKATGTASLKDILNMNDAGAHYYADFSYLGYPSTYMLDHSEVLGVFNKLDLKYANNKENFWVVEFADGINQRETAMLLRSEEVRSRIHKLVFCAADAFGAIGGLEVLKREFDLIPDAISGVLSSSPLHIRELQSYTSIPIFNSMDTDTISLFEILSKPRRRRKSVIKYDQL